jgi:hypothetical protein
MDNRAIRLPPSTRRNIFAAHTAQQPEQRQQPHQQAPRRQNQNVPSIRPDSREIEQDIFMQPAQEEFVERDAVGEYVVKAPTPVYKDMGVGSEGDEEVGTLHSHIFPFPLYISRLPCDLMRNGRRRTRNMEGYG